MGGLLVSSFRLVLPERPLDRVSSLSAHVNFRLSIQRGNGFAIASRKRTLLLFRKLTMVNPRGNACAG